LNTPSKILLIHESYAVAGGEDTAVDADLALLEANGHRVTQWRVSNRDILRRSTLHRVPLLWQTTWSTYGYSQISDLINRIRPDIVHFHNTLPLISPSAFHAASRLPCAVVFTLHNYRLGCAVGTYSRNGMPCERCTTHSVLSGIYYGCYRGSRLQTAAVAAMQTFHRAIRTWERCVDAFITMTAFAKGKMTALGLPGERIHIRPSPVIPPTSPEQGTADYAIYAGRLSDEKGIRTLIQAARLQPDLSFVVLGEGPLEAQVRESVASGRLNIALHGHTGYDEALRWISKARVLVFPSNCYETFGRAIVEALSLGVPVVASRLGAISEIIADGKEGFLVEPGDATGLADRVHRIMRNDELRTRMSAAARERYESQYSSATSYSSLIAIYQAALSSARLRGAIA
jgi:glycosyltransferase involved in cell wall biosynthesis